VIWSRSVKCPHYSEAHFNKNAPSLLAEHRCLYATQAPKEVNTRNGALLATGVSSQNHSDAPRRFGEDLPAGTRLTLFSDDKPDRFFTVIKFWMDATSGVALELKTGVPTYQVEDGLPRRRLAGGGRKAEHIY
jgi:hypothetical protein